MYFSNKKLIKNIKVFFYMFYHNIFLSIFTPHFCKKNTFEIFKPNVQVLRDCWQAYHQYNKERLKKQLTIGTWSQKLGNMAGLGLRICRRMLTNCCFWYFFSCISFKVIRGQIQPRFQQYEATLQQSIKKKS